MLPTLDNTIHATTTASMNHNIMTNNNNNNGVAGMNSNDSLVNLAASIQHPISTTMTSTTTISAAEEGEKLGGSTEDACGNTDMVMVIHLASLTFNPRRERFPTFGYLLLHLF